MSCVRAALNNIMARWDQTSFDRRLVTILLGISAQELSILFLFLINYWASLNRLIRRHKCRIAGGIMVAILS